MDVLDVIGDFGRYQKEILALLSLRSVLVSSTFFLVYLFGSDVDHWCKPPEGFGNLTQDEWKDCCIPKNDKGIDHCYRYDLDNFDNNTRVYCDEWDYDKTVRNSIRAEWDLVCDRKWLMSQAYAMFYLGNLVTFPFAGYVADRIGRRKAVLIGCFGLLITNTSLYFSNSITWFLVVRFLTGLPYTFLQSVTVTCFMEVTGPKQRPLNAFFTGATSALSAASLLGISMLTTQWRTLALITSFPIILPWIILCWRYLPESPRWLISSGKPHEARKVLALATRKNKIVIQDMDGVIKALQMKVQEGKENQQEERLMDFIKEKKLLGITCLLILSNTVNSFSANGFFIAIRGLGGSFHTNFAISQSTTFVASFLSSWILCYVIRRRRVLIFAFLASGFLYFITTALGQDLLWLRVTLAMLARMCNSLLFQTLTVFENEIFPTNLRGRGYTLCMMAGRVGATLSSYIDLLIQTRGGNAPFFLFGGICTAIGLAYFLVPEVENRNLPDSVAESKRNLESNAVPVETTKIARDATSNLVT